MIAAGRTEDHQYDVLARALISLLRCGLTRREQLVVRAILLARTPSTAFNVAQRTGLAYSHVKAAVRTLLAWQILTRSAEGLCFQLRRRAGDRQRWMS